MQLSPTTRGAISSSSSDSSTPEEAAAKAAAVDLLEAMQVSTRRVKVVALWDSYTRGPTLNHTLEISTYIFA